LPARLQALVGNYSIAVIAVCGLLTALIALCFAEIGSRFDRSGGPQLYASLAFGPGVGFAVGWLLWISRIGTCAAVSNLLIDYGKILVPQARPACCPRRHDQHPRIRLYVDQHTRYPANRGSQRCIHHIKLIPLVAFAIIGLFFIEPQHIQLGSLPPVTNLSTAILLAGFAYMGL